MNIQEWSNNNLQPKILNFEQAIDAKAFDIAHESLKEINVDVKTAQSIFEKQAQTIKILKNTVLDMGESLISKIDEELPMELFYEALGTESLDLAFMHLEKMKSQANVAQNITSNILGQNTNEPLLSIHDKITDLERCYRIMDQILHLSRMAPIGINRRFFSNDCFLISTLQIILNSPSLIKAIRSHEGNDLEIICQLIDGYLDAENQGNQVAYLDTGAMRKWWNPESRNETGDTAEVLRTILDTLGITLDLNYVNRHGVIQHQAQDMLNLPLADGARDFNILLNLSMEEDVNELRIFNFKSSPSPLIINAMRYSFDQETLQPTILTDPIEEVPIEMGLYDQGIYQITGCTIHSSAINAMNMVNQGKEPKSSSNLADGHYVALVRKENGMWYLLNDKKVNVLDKAEAKKYLALGCQFIYEPVTSEEDYSSDGEEVFSLTQKFLHWISPSSYI